MKKLSMPARPPSSIIRITPKLFNVSTNAFFMRIRNRILDPHWKKWIQIQIRIRIQVISLKFTELFYKIIFKFFVLFFRLL